ncbi:tyrosine-type recombinase/integrase [Bifidobacterium platyrrhinorum]|uniref:Tyrosine-type recombinase/integrase n=1 Tax=Bifidobacterium platyrrhinorum TaxID=2661628 RepID=A0A6L9SUD8_9BIFI|nr:tyrosine-type recombinase/integrase [Bifidobacterium platyrrhinorum]NEG56168.1 tyrosine-type recombinase/integrase [Bifidobacterium platyrrhinorum]
MATTRRRTKGAGGVFKDSKGRWHFRREITPDPVTGRRRVIEATGRVKSEARARFDEKVAEYERTGRIRTSTGPTVAGYSDRWMERHRADVKPNTWANEAGWLRLLCTRLGDIPLRQLTADHIRAALRDLGRTRAGSSLQVYLSVLSSMLDSAVLDRIIDENPARLVKPPRAKAKERAILDSSQPARLVAATATPAHRPHAKASPEECAMYALAFELAFSTGIRPGERRGLMPYQLERRNGVPGINVCQQLQSWRGGAADHIPDWVEATHLEGSMWITSPKSDRGNRFIPLSEDLWNRLWEHIITWGIAPHQLIFANQFGRPITSKVETVRWKRALEDAKLPDVDIYSARHLVSTELAETGASPDERMRLMGHASLSTTARYTHWSPEALAQTMNRAIPQMSEA